MGIDLELTDKTRSRYDRIAGLYNLAELPAERFLYTPWRKRLWAGVKGPAVLEAWICAGQ